MLELDLKNLTVKYTSEDVNLCDILDIVSFLNPAGDMVQGLPKEYIARRVVSKVTQH